MIPLLSVPNDTKSKVTCTVCDWQAPAGTPIYQAVALAFAHVQDKHSEELHPHLRDQLATDAADLVLRPEEPQP